MTNTLDYDFVKLLYVVMSQTPKQISALTGWHVSVVELALFTDLKLRPEDQKPYTDMPLADRLKILDLERRQAFWRRYLLIESRIVDKTLTYLNNLPDEAISPKDLRTLAQVVTSMRAPAYSPEGAAELGEQSRTSVDCEARAREAAERLDALRAARGVQ